MAAKKSRAPQKTASAGVVQCHGVKVPASPFLSDALIEQIERGTYEQRAIAGALAVVKPGDRVLEIGSGLGVVGAVIAKQAKPEKVLSFEANPALIPDITALYKLNRLSKKIELRHGVVTSLSDGPATLPFAVRDEVLQSSLIESDQETAATVDVPVASYDEIVAGFAPDVLVMNIHGGELELLRQAPLEGLRAIIVEFHPDAYGRSGMRACKSILTDAGFRKNAAHSSRHLWICEHTPALSAPLPEGGWSREFSVLDQAIVMPPAEQGFVQEAGILDRNAQYCPSGALWRNGRALSIAPKPPNGDLPHRKGTWLWGGVLWMHFGHFLVESSARFWALDHVDEKIDGILFVPRRVKNGSDVAGFQRDFVKLMDGDLDIACAGTPETVERLIVPGQGFGLGAMSVGTEEYRDVMRKRLGKDIAPDGSKRLYISRSKLPPGRGNLIGEADLEANLSEAGYTIYHPEKHDLNHQIATYKAAEKVIAAEGSALHLLAMVAHPDAQVAIVVRRPSGATRNIERHLGAFMGRPPGTITQLARSWKPLGKSRPRLWMGELDMPALQASLIDEGLIEKGKTWAPLDPNDVMARLGDRFEEVA